MLELMSTLQWPAVDHWVAAVVLAIVLVGLGARLAMGLHQCAVAVYGGAHALPVMQAPTVWFLVWFVPLAAGLFQSVSLSGLQVSVWLLFASLLGLLALIDAHTGLLPNELTLGLLSTGLVWQVLRDPTPALGYLPQVEYCWGVVLGWLVPTAFNSWHERRRGATAIGQGDARLLAGIGGWLGAPSLPAVWVMSCLAMLLYLVVQLLVTRRWQSRVALGPFLAAGASVSMLAPWVGQALPLAF